MNTPNCLEAAMFAAAENYSLGVYELGECFEAEIAPVDDTLHLVQLFRDVQLQKAA